MTELADALTAEFGRGFGTRHLHDRARFADVFPDAEIVHALRSQLSWTHLRELIAIDDPLGRRYVVPAQRVYPAGANPTRAAFVRPIAK